MRDLVGTYGPMILGAIVSAVAGWLGIAAHRRAWLRDFLGRVERERRSVVLEVEQVFVDERLKAKRADSPGGVELTPGEQAAALDTAVNRLWELLGLSTLDRALRLLGLPTTPDFVRRYLRTHVEAAVKQLSIEQTAAVAKAEIVTITETPAGPIVAGPTGTTGGLVPGP